MITKPMNPIKVRERVAEFRINHEEGNTLVAIKRNGEFVPIDVQGFSDINVPVNTSELENDAGFITEEDVPTKVSDLENDSGFLESSEVSDVALTGDYRSLENQPSLEGVAIEGDKTFEDYGLTAMSNIDIMRILGESEE